MKKTTKTTSTEDRGDLNVSENQLTSTPEPCEIWKDGDKLNVSENLLSSLPTSLMKRKKPRK